MNKYSIFIHNLIGDFMSKYKVDITNIDTSNLKVLSNDEMIKLFKENKKEELINGNLRLVLSILKNYKTRVDNMDDLFQVGCIGLIKAIDNFDLKYNVKFSTYAVPMILGEIRRYIRDTTSLRISRSIKDTAYKILKVKELLTNKNNKEPSIEELSNYLGISEYDIALALNSMKDTLSFSEPIYNDGGDTIYLEDQIKKDDYYSLDLKIALKDAIGKIKEKERLILLERYILGKTQLEISESLGISQAQVSRLEKNGIEDIKKLIL